MQNNQSVTGGNQLRTGAGTWQYTESFHHRAESKNSCSESQKRRGKLGMGQLSTALPPEQL
jgi:hypothetical protein